MIKIMGDSTCDLSENILSKYNIGIVPLNVIFQGKSYRDRLDISADEFYKKLSEKNLDLTTSMPSPEAFYKAFNEAKEKGYSRIICICMSSGTSGSYQSAVIAKELFLEDEKNKSVQLEIIDSYSMSLGSGYLIMKAGQMLEEGYEFEDIIDYVKEYRMNVKHYLCVDDLTNLIKSGRLSNSSALIGKLLRVKPIMTMKNKKGSLVAKERGWKRVYKHYIDEFEIRVDEEESNFILIGYTDNKKLAEDFKKEFLGQTSYTGDIYLMQKGPAVGTHVGLNGLSMFYIEKGHISDNIVRSRLKKRKEQLENLLK